MVGEIVVVMEVEKLILFIDIVGILEDYYNLDSLIVKLDI